MNVMGKSIIVGLALLVGSNAVASQRQDFNYLSGVKSGQYSDLKNQYQRNPSPDLLNALQAKLNQIPSVIVDKPKPLHDNQVNWYNAEKAWVDSLVAAAATRAPAIPAAPAGAPTLAQGPIKGRSKFDTQQQRMRQLMSDFAAASPDIDAMRNIYANAQQVLSKLTLIPEGDRNDVLNAMQGAIKDLTPQYPLPTTPPERIKSEFDAAEKAFNDMYAQWQATPTIGKLLQMQLLFNDAKKIAADRYNQLIDQSRVDSLTKKYNTALIQTLRELKKHFDAAYTNGSVERARSPYNSFITFYPGLVDKPDEINKAFIDISRKYAELLQAQATARIADLFEFLASNKTVNARRAESALIRILSNANRPNEAAQQDALLSIIGESEESAATQENAQSREAVIREGLRKAFNALVDMITSADKQRTAPITADDMQVKYL